MTVEADQVDLLAQGVTFISSTDSRNKIYRLIQYGAKMFKWVLVTKYELTASDLRQADHQHLGARSNAAVVKECDAMDSEERAREVATGPESTCANAPTIRTYDIDQQKERARWLAIVCTRIEALFGDARKVYRFFQFLEMLEMLRHVHEPIRSVRVLRRVRIVCFFFFYLLENYMIFLLRIEGFPRRHSRVRLLKRSCNGFWCLSILLTFPLDHLMNRGSRLSTIKKLLDLPVSYLAFSDRHVSDGLFSMLGLASAKIGVYLSWLDVAAKMRHTRVLQNAHSISKSVH